MVMGSLNLETEVAVIGGGPGGYVAAIRAADLGKEVTLIEERETLGGVCLIEGCIPSKALIHAVAFAQDARDAEKMGFRCDNARLDVEALRQWTRDAVADLTGGIAGLLKRRGIEVVRGRARFRGTGVLDLEHSEVGSVQFKHCVIATGSRINEIPAAYEKPVWSSAEALKIPSVPERLLVVGGGYIGLELGYVYAGLGSKVTLVEFFPRLLLGADPDLVQVVVKECRRLFSQIRVDSKVTGIEKTSAGFAVSVDHEGRVEKDEYDQVLVAVGRKPNTDDLGLENTAVIKNDHGIIEVDEQGRTAEPGVYAIGDVTRGPMLAHKASREGKVVAEVIAKHPSAFDNRAIPAVVFTHPEMAWVGLTEQEAEKAGVPVSVGRFPLKALGKARAIGRTEGFVKVLCEPESGRVLGLGMVGAHVSEMIAEGALALEMGATLEDLMVTIHPHPTLSEALSEAAEVAAGIPIHIDIKKRE